MSAEPSLAEQHATTRGLPVVPCLAHDLLSALTGNPLIVRLLDGSEALLRLATVDEAVTFQLEALATLPAFVRPEPMSRAEAERLVRPLQVEGWTPR